MKSFFRFSKICNSTFNRKVLSYNKILSTHTYNRRFFSSEQLDLIVVGGGPGGYACAIKAAQLGLKSLCVEGRGRLGGTCLNVGCIPSKSLLNNTHMLHQAQHDFEKRGILVDNVRIDLEKLMAAKSQAVMGLTQGIEGLFKKNKVQYAKGWGKITGNNEVTVQTLDNKTEKYTAKNIVIATGSDSARIPSIEIDEKDIVTSTGALEFTEIPKRMVVVGAGVIGLEMGSVWSRLGTEVTVVEFLDRILPGTDLDMTKKFQKILQKQGLNFKLSTGVQAVNRSNNELQVVVKDTKTDKEETISTDKVLISIGRVPYTTGLGLEELNVEMDGPRKNMVKVNDNFQSTSHPNIYGIGDVIRGPMLAHKAEEEGIAVAEILAGLHGHVNYNAIPGVIYTYPEVAFVGKSEEDLKSEGVEYKKGEFPFLANSRARANSDSDGFVKILSDKNTDRILGVHIVGPNAGEMISEAVIGIEYGASSEDLGRTCHAHPTLSEAFKEACMNTYSKAIHI